MYRAYAPPPAPPPAAPQGSGGPLKFSTAPFLHNARVAAALLPALAMALGPADRGVLGLCLLGALLTYTLDAARAREGALASAWATLCLTNLGLLVTRAPCPAGRPWSLCAGAALFNGAALGLAGVWATLQFRWVQAHYPVACLALERALLAAAGPLGTAALGLLCLPALAPGAAPFGTAAGAAAMFLCLGVPLPSSFPAAAGGGRGKHAPAPMQRGAGGTGGAATTRGDAARAAALFALLPLAQHLAMQSRVLLSTHSAADPAARSDAGWAALLLASLPWMVMALAPGGLAWAGRGRTATRGVRRRVLLAAAPAAVAGLEGRVLRRAVSPYLALPPPWSYLAFTAALAPVVAFGCAQAAGLLEAEEDAAGGGTADLSATSSAGVAPLPRSAAAAGPLLVVAAGAAGLAAGLPLWALPAPLAAGAGLTLYWESGGAGDYLLFAAGAAGAGAWFVGHHFWFLDVDLGAGHSLRSAVATAGVAGLAALAVPGLLGAGASGLAGGGWVGRPAKPRAATAPGLRPALTAAALLAQAALVCLLEDHLFAGDHADPEAAPELYPAYLVAATSAAGLAAARAAGRAGLAPRGAAWLLACVWGAKASLLALPASRPVAPVLGVVLAATAPAALWGGEGPPPSSIADRPPPPAAARLALAALALLAAARARFVLFDALREYGYDGAPPVDGAALGALLAAAGAAAAPALWVGGGSRAGEDEGGQPARRRGRPDPASLALARRLAAATVAGGLAALALEPPQPRRLLGADGCPALPLPFGWCPRLWDAAHAPDHYAPGDAGGAASWGADGLDRRGGGPAAWLLVGAAGAAAAAGAVSVVGSGGGPDGAPPLATIGVPGAALAAAAAAGAGAYVSGAAFPGAPAGLHAAVIASVVATAAALVALLRARPRRGAVWAPRALAAWAGALGAAGWVASRAPLPLPPAAATLFPDAAHAAAADAAAGVRVALAALAAGQCLLLALGLKLRVGRALAASGGPGGGVVPTSAPTGGLDAAAREAWAAAGGAAASFLGACLPAGAAPAALAAASRRASGGGGGGGRVPSSSSPGAAAAAAAAAAGLAWAPTVGNLLALVGAALAAGPVGGVLRSGPPGAALLLSPALLLLGPDPVLAAGLADGRRYAPPALAAFAGLAARSVADLARDRAARAAFTGWVHEQAAAGALGTTGAGPGREAGALAACAPGAAAVLLAAWRSGGGGTGGRRPRGPPAPLTLLACAAPALVALAAGQLASTRWLAGSVVAGCVAGVVGVRSLERAGRRGL